MAFKKTLENIFLILIPLGLMVFFVAAFNKYLDFKILRIYNDSQIGKIGEIEQRDKGVSLLKLDANRNHLFLIGSSELRSWVSQNPKNMFPNSQLPANITVLGMPLVQSLHDAIRIGSIGSDLSGKNVCLMLSMQWFMQKEGISNEQFKPHFSKVQFYEFLKNKKISENSKSYLCKRVNDLMYSQNEGDNFLEERVYAKFYKNKFLLSLISPYYYLKNEFLLLKDKHQSFKMIKEYEKLPKKLEVKQINWEEEQQKAFDEGEGLCTTNDFFMSDHDWNRFIAEIIDSLKMAYKNTDLQNSKEYDDLNLLFEVCKHCEIKPYVIILSNNGFYYDYTGITTDERNELYNRLQNICKEFAFDYLDIRDKEYEPYFFRDGMHLGWKGWLYVNQKITEYFKGKG